MNTGALMNNAYLGTMSTKSTLRHEVETRHNAYHSVAGYDNTKFLDVFLT